MSERLSHNPISRALTSTLDDLRDLFLPYVRTYDVLFERRRDLAPTFMRAFERWQRETGRSFVAFVQQLDSTVPSEKAAYASHRSYQASLYLKRLVEAPETVAGRAERRSRTPLDMLAIVVKSALPLVRPHEATFWSSFSASSRWHQRDVVALQRRVGRARPIALRPDVPRLVREGRREVRSFGTSPIASAAERG